MHGPRAAHVKTQAGMAMATTSELIFKILQRQAWDEAVALGVYRGSPDDARDGFIHFSTASQSRGTAAKYFAGQPDLVLVAVAAEQLGEALKWEPSRGGELFPHLYGELATRLAKWVRPLPLDANNVPEIRAAMNGNTPS
jgi:uncharacterized protein (DUF952 family)